MKIGKFEILAELGQGAMGKVYRARDSGIGREVALKTVTPSLLQDPQIYARFKREAQSAGRLHHPNIVTIYELGEEADGTLFIAMELVEGMDLGQAMHPVDHFPLDQKVRMVADICRGLDYAHKQGVVHRDVKPANVRISRDGVVKILDFGIARPAESEMTSTGLLLGTPSYMSPEVLKGARVDYRADMWATGIILFEVLSGKRPFEADTIPGLVYKIVHEPLPPVDMRGAPEALVAVARKTLEKTPSDRYADMADMARALLNAIGATPPADPVVDPAVRIRSYERNFEEARQRLADNDLTAALQAARRAQAFDPAKTAIMALISTIEEQLRSIETVRRPAPEAPRPGPQDATRQVGLPPSTRVSYPTVELTPLATAPPSLGTATLTDLRTRGASVFRELATFGGPPATQAVGLSPVKDVLAVAGNDGAIRMWDLYSRAKVETLRTELHERAGHDALALCLAFSPDGKLLASGHVDANVHLWDLERGHEVPVKLRHDAVVGALAFSPDGSTLAAGSVDSSLRLWDVGAAYAGEARRELFRQPASVSAVAYAGGGEWLITGHSNKVLRMLDARTGRLLASIRGPEAPVSLILPSPDGQHIAVVSQDRLIRLFDLSSREQVAAVVAGHRKTATSLCFLAEGKHLACVAQENEVQLWDLETSKPIAALSGPATESFVGLALFGAGDHLAVALGDGRIRLWGPAS